MEEHLRHRCLLNWPKPMPNAVVILVVDGHSWLTPLLLAKFPKNFASKVAEISTRVQDKPLLQQNKF